jgi:hypothetical protein
MHDLFRSGNACLFSQLDSLPQRIGPDHAGIHREVLATDNAVRHAESDLGSEQLPEQATVAKLRWRMSLRSGHHLCRSNSSGIQVQA